jgi:hypothetical protein
MQWVPIKWVKVTLFLLKVHFYLSHKKYLLFSLLPGSGSAWIRIHFQNWIRIRIKSMRIRNTGLASSGSASQLDIGNL